MTALPRHPNTERQVQAFIDTPSHAAIIFGPAGSGKLTIAQELAEAVLGLKPAGFSDYAYGRLIRPSDSQTIGIEAIRELERFLSLKVPSDQVYSRGIIIEDAHSMTLEAQNALLKMLEEPPAGTIILLTAAHAQALLPTVRSRSQSLTVQLPDHAALKQYFQTQGHASAQIEQAYAISGGLPGLMSALLSEDEHPLLKATECARQLLSQSRLERLVMVDELAKQRALAADTLFILQQMARVSLRSAGGKASQKWQNVLQASYQTAEVLSTNAQAKLALTDLMLKL